MSFRIQSVSGHERRLLGAVWQLCATLPNSVEHPAGLPATTDWLCAETPSTVAAALRLRGVWSLDAAPRRFDSEDWWYRTRFARGPASAGHPGVLVFEGLATLADVWLNGDLLLQSRNMFLAHECFVGDLLRDDNELTLCFRAIDSVLLGKRPRPRWRTPMVEHQQLRYLRTTLLGRTPGWSPPSAAVGPWRPVWIESRPTLAECKVSLNTSLDGDVGVAVARCSLRASGANDIVRVTLVLSRDEQEFTQALRLDRDNGSCEGALRIPNVARWWPHTHGEPCLYEAQLLIERGGSNDRIDVKLGRVGFRTIEVDTSQGDFSVRVNGVPVFCRGACWTPIDVVSLHASKDASWQALEQLRRAGLNMVRVGGMTVYESDDFLDACDAQGILLWQDFMFSNMDYPDDDEVFVASVTEEARQQLHRLTGRPCLAVVCGNSEGEQQAAMWGAPRELWQPKLFHEILPRLTREICGDVRYWPSSAHGGAFPHQGSVGTTSYYGVGAYLRPMHDARHAEIRFASECLAFANVPEERTFARMPGGPALRVHHPAWKSRTPRDLGAGWDFDDVRDHYLATLFGVDVLATRYSDPERYFALSRVVTGEVMAGVFAEWRRSRSTCRGGLIWFWRDLWAGAGWGVIDDAGFPKAAYHYLQRTLQPVAVALSDEGGNGLVVHATNERNETLDATLDIELFRGGERCVGRASRAVSLPARGAAEWSAIDWFPGFLDLSYAYRFGPPGQDLIVATLRDSQGHSLSQAFHFDLGATAAHRYEAGLTATATSVADGKYEVLVRAQQFAQSVSFDAEGFVPDDNYFHLAPGATATVTLRALAGPPPRALRGRVHALNLRTPARIEVRK